MSSRTLRKNGSPVRGALAILRYLESRPGEIVCYAKLGYTESACRAYALQINDHARSNGLPYRVLAFTRKHELSGLVYVLLGKYSFAERTETLRARSGLHDLRGRPCGR